MGPPAPQRCVGCGVWSIPKAMVLTEVTRDSKDFAEVFRRVRTIDIAPDEIYDGRSAVQMLDPFADGARVGIHLLNAIVPPAPLAGQNDHLVITRAQLLHQRPADKYPLPPAITTRLS